MIATLVANSGAVDFYSNTNRQLYWLPRSTAMCFADRGMSIDGSPNMNPALLALAKEPQMSISYAGYYQNTISSSILSLTSALQSNIGLGLSINYLYIPDILITDHWATGAGGELIVGDERYASASEMLAHGALGYRFPILPSCDILAGVAFNVRRQRDIEWTAYGFGLDGGALVRFAKAGLVTGLLFENITTHVTYWSSSYIETSAPHIYFTLSEQAEIEYLYGRIQFHYASLDLAINEGVNSTVTGNDSLETPKVIRLKDDPFGFFINGSFGIEYLIYDRVALRFGTSAFRQFSFGGGLYLLSGRLGFDFAYLSSELAPTYQASMTVGIR